jgi:general secretion pathway protein G
VTRHPGILDFGFWILDWPDKGTRLSEPLTVPVAQDPVPLAPDKIQNPKSKIQNRKGFTLIEVLVVMIILAILAAIVVPRVVGREEDARRARAVSDVESIGTALDMYKADNGEYPTTEEGLQALRTQAASAKNWNGPYLKKALTPDPWGNPYVYTSPGEHNADSYDLSSYGADGQPGGDGKNADVTNWDEQEQK